jgi:hypothetical protein
MLKWWFRPWSNAADSALLSLPEQTEEPESIAFSKACRQTYGAIGAKTRLPVDATAKKSPKHASGWNPRLIEGGGDTVRSVLP